jgi:VCBS repeat-containing protein
MADTTQAGIIQTATSVLRAAILAPTSDFASWIGWEYLQRDGATIETALKIVDAIKANNFTLDDLCSAAQSKTGIVAADKIGNPDPSLTVLGYEFDIGHLLGGTTVEVWTSSGKNPQYHSREYFNSLGTEPANYDEDWANPNTAPTADDYDGTTVEDGAIIEGDLYAHDEDGDVLTYTLQGDAPAGLTFNNGHYKFDPSDDAYQSLAAGQEMKVSVDVLVSDGKGGEVISKLSFTVVGTNDAAIVSADHVDLTETNEVLQTSGQLTVSDVDGPDTFQAGTIAGSNGTFVIEEDGHWTYTATSALDELNVTDVVIETFGVKAADGTPTSVTVTIGGTNDAPTVSGAVTGTATENGVVSTVDALANASDIDKDHTLSVVDVPGELPAGVSYDAATHSFTLDPKAPLYNHLAQGASTTVTVAYKLSDEHGAKADASVSWTITGTNDAPVAKAHTDAATEDTTITGSVAGDYDVDDGAVLTYTLDARVAGLTFEADGSYKFDASHSDYQNIHAGKTQDIVVQYTVEDEFGAKSSSTLTITLTGTKDLYTGFSADVDAITKIADGQKFNFDFAVNKPADAFDFTGTVTVTAHGDVDGANEHVFVMTGEIKDTNGDGTGLMDLYGSSGGNGPSEGLNATVSGWAEVVAGGFNDGHITLAGEFHPNKVGNGTTVDAHLDYSYWM